MGLPQAIQEQGEENVSIFEVGCGAGAFLFALRQLYPKIQIAGIDYADGQIKFAERAIPDGEFRVQEATAIDTQHQYDFVIANSVFHYFSQQYAEEVVRRMIRKCRNGVAVTEVPDAGLREELEATRRGALSVEEYQAKYEGLGHTYYLRSWFAGVVERAMPGQFEVSIGDGVIPNYVQNRFRFNCFIRKTT